MNPVTSTHKTQAFTRLDWIMAGAALALLTLFVGVPSLKQSWTHARRIGCVSHLKNIGLAFRTAAVDRGDFLFHLPEAKGGTAPYALDPAELWRHFVVLSNELSTPRITVCPTDTRRPTFYRWHSIITNDHNRAMSYTVGIDAREEEPDSILSCDRNLTLDGLPVGMSVLNLRKGDPIQFSTELHGEAGNLLLGDGSVQQVNQERLGAFLTNAVQSSRAGKIRIVVP